MITREKDIFERAAEALKAHAAVHQLREEVRTLLKGGMGGSQDLTEIRRIVTLIALAMPAVAKHV